MRLVPTRSTRSNRPFQGQGASLYVGTGAAANIAYTNLRAWPRRGSFTAGPNSQIGGANTLKTARVASVNDPTNSIGYALPGSFASQAVFAQVRTFKDDCENDTLLNPARVDLDGSLNDASTIDGTATLLRQQQRDDGVVRVRFNYFPALTGLAPLIFRLHRTAGPSSPADVTINYSSFQTLYVIDTPALLDSAPYTFTLTAENGLKILTLASGISVQADATGPAAPASGSAQPW